MNRTRKVSLTAGTAALALATAFTAAGSAGAQTRIPGCTPVGNVQAIIDDSASMSSSDPNELRRTGMEIVIQNSGNTGKTLDAVEFGSKANPVFGPGPIGRQTRPFMVGQLRSLIDADNGGTDYDEGFVLGRQQNPNAGARIFLTDGAHNGQYGESHRGGARTFVVGLDIGAPGSGSNADRLQRIANETGGRYFPSVTSRTLQSTFNAINSAINCLRAPRTFASKLFFRAGQSDTERARFARGARRVDLLLNWSEPGNAFTISRVKALGRKNKVLATLSGKGKPRKLKVSRSSGDTFKQFTIRRPRGAKKIAFRIKAKRVVSSEQTITELSQRR